jgi:nucleoside-specific outer membrane channel protein Tsx
MRNPSLVALGACALLTLPVQAADWSDTYLGYRYGTQFQEPGIADKITKNVFSLNHASGYSLGSNFFSVDMLKSDSLDPANTEGTGFKSGGAHEVYVAYRTNLSMAKTFKTKIDFGPVRGIDLTAGFDFSAKDTTFAPRVWKVLVGPTFNFKVPGFLNVGLLYYSEKNHNAFGGFALSKGGAIDVTFDPTYMVAVSWGIPAPLGSVNTTVKGFLNYTGAKGKDGSGVETKPETLMRAYWMFDLSPLFGTKKNTWQIGPGYEYWDNKFGDPTNATKAETPAGQVVNPKTNCLMIALEVHF